MGIRLKECVKFRQIPFEMLFMMFSILYAGEAQGVEPVLTGAAFENYPKGKVHDRGYALDIRTSNLPDPQAFADTVHRYLRAVSPYYVVLYGDAQHRDHIHIGFSWYFSRDSLRERNHGKCEKLGLVDSVAADRVGAVASGNHTANQGSVRG